MPVSQQSNYHNQQPHVGLPNGPNSMGPPSFNSANKMPQQGMMAGNVPGGCPPAGQQGYPQGNEFVSYFLHGFVVALTYD